MPRLGIPTAICPQIHPEDGIPLNRPKRDARLAVVRLALQKPTPLAPRRHAQPREIRAAARTLVAQIHHERADAVAALRRRPRPVIVVAVVAGRVVALRPHALDVQVWAPALERSRAVFDAADDRVAGEERPVREPFARVDLLRLAVVDY